MKTASIAIAGVALFVSGIAVSKPAITVSMRALEQCRDILHVRTVTKTRTIRPKAKPPEVREVLKYVSLPCSIPAVTEPELRLSPFSLPESLSRITVEPIRDTSRLVASDITPRIVYAPPTPAAGFVPEPETWSMFIAGFIAVGTTMRLRRREEAKA